LALKCHAVEHHAALAHDFTDIHLKGFELTAVNANNQSLKGFESQKDWKFFIV
jgi:hypothetical protein